MAIQTPRIAIVGAGPAGLVLARILYNNGIRTTLYDTDVDPDERPQGGSLDLHPGSGQEAIHAAGLWKEFERYARFEDEYLTLTTPANEIVYTQHEQGQSDRPEIDRKHLRSILLDSIPADMIQWNKHLSRAEPGRLIFRDGTVADGFDLIVGADGAWSRIRSLLTPIKPFYSGILGFEFSIPNVAARTDLDAEVKGMLGRGSYWAFGDESGKAFLALHMSDGSSHAYVMNRVPEDWAKESGVDWADARQGRECLQRVCADFAPNFHKVLAAIDAPVVPRPLYMLPPGLRWPHRRGVAVVGDAAHVMTPFAGEGVNQAMTDSLHLAREILGAVQSGGDIDAGVKAYEKWLFPAAAKVTGKTWESLMDRFDEGGNAKFHELFTGGGPDGEPVKRTI